MNSVNWEGSLSTEQNHIETCSLISGVLELACTSLQASVYFIAFFHEFFQTSWCCIGSLKSAMVVFIPWKSALATDQGLCFGEPVKHLPAPHWIHPCCFINQYSFFFKLLINFQFYGDIIICLLFICWDLGCFQFLIVKNKVAMTINKYKYGHMLSLLLGKHPWML